MQKLKVDVKTTSLVERIISDAYNGNPPTDKDEIASLFEIPTFSEESFRLQAASRELSEMACDGKAEVHAQTALNIGPCTRNCLFCSFAVDSGVFNEEKEFPLDYMIDTCVQFERDGASAVFLMATGIYAFEKFVEKGAEIRGHLKEDTTFIANAGDFNLDQARELKQAGFDGIYHAVRLGEGEVTSIPIEHRLETVKAAHKAGLSIGT
jgi:biotin synthase